MSEATAGIKAVWRRLIENSSNAAKAPRPRQGHSATYIDEPIEVEAQHYGLSEINVAIRINGCILILGGYDGSRLFDFETDVWALDVNQNLWVKFQLHGDVPCARYRHAAILLRGFVYIYGGFDGNRTFTDLYTLDLRSLKWSKLEYTNSSPSARLFRACVYIGDNKLMIFGGSQTSEKSGERTMQQFVLDLDTLKWSTVAYEGDAPTARSYNSVGVAGDSIYIYGGYNGSMRFGDMYVFDISTCRWSMCKTTNTPGGRYKHTATMFQRQATEVSSVSEKPDIFMMVFGGYGIRWLNELIVWSSITSTWSALIDSAGEVPSAREGHSATLVNSKLFIFGGWSFPSYFNDVYMLDVKEVMGSAKVAPFKSDVDMIYRSPPAGKHLRLSLSDYVGADGESYDLLSSVTTQALFRANRSISSNNLIGVPGPRLKGALPEVSSAPALKAGRDASSQDAGRESVTSSPKASKTGVSFSSSQDLDAGTKGGSSLNSSTVGAPMKRDGSSKSHLTSKSAEDYRSEYSGGGMDPSSSANSSAGPNDAQSSLAEGGSVLPERTCSTDSIFQSLALLRASGERYPVQGDEVLQKKGGLESLLAGTSARDQYRILKEVERRVEAAMEMNQNELTHKKTERDRRQSTLEALEETVEDLRLLAVKEEAQAGKSHADFQELEKVLEELTTELETTKNSEAISSDTHSVAMRGELEEFSKVFDVREDARHQAEGVISDLTSAIEQLAAQLSKKEEEWRMGEAIASRLETALESLEKSITERNIIQREAEREAQELRESNAKLEKELEYLSQQKQRAVMEKELLESAVGRLVLQLDEYGEANHEAKAVATQLRADLEALQVRGHTKH